jgi:hypothetical protein
VPECSGSWRLGCRCKGKLKQKVVIAVARELLGFIWVLGVQVEREKGISLSARRQAAWEDVTSAEGTGSNGARKGVLSAILCDRASAWTRECSSRQLPTDHDHDGGPQARSTNIRSE